MKKQHQQVMLKVAELALCICISDLSIVFFKLECMTVNHFK